MYALHVGDAGLSDIPDDLWADGAESDRQEWLEAKLSEPSKQWLDTLRRIAASITLPVGEDAEDGAVASEVANIMSIVDPPPAKDATLGPTFAGSQFVGGADADLILDHCLWEVKTTENPRDRLTPGLRQLIGYALLDWDDAYELNRVGFCFSRQAAWTSWRLSDLVRRTATSGATLTNLRDEFRTLAGA